MYHLSNDNPEIELQILGILRLMTWNANVDVQDDVFIEMSDSYSEFCEKVYRLLEGVLSSFIGTWAR